MGVWSIDLGTTNTAVARWDPADSRPKLVDLPSICRRPEGADPLEAPRMVPSATRLVDHPDFWTRLGRRGILAQHAFLGREAIIGRPAMEMDKASRSPAFVPGFKGYLEREPRRPVARAGDSVFSARDVARIFMRELLAETQRVTGERIRDLVVTAPVDAYESYRAELQAVGRHLGIWNLRFVDEPVAAALGYGLGLSGERHVVVVDLGGGTMHVALVALSPKQIERGACRVVAKEGRAIGGDTVNRWLLRDFCKRLDYPLNEDPPNEADAFWYRLLVAEACRVKEALFLKEGDLFSLIDLRAVEMRMAGKATTLAVTKRELVENLRLNGYYRLLEECLDGVIQTAGRQGVSVNDVTDVLMVGGSTLLPQIYSIVETRFGRDRVRAWQPFEAVAYGGAAFASGAYGQSDFIVHDYAFVTHDPTTHQPEYTVIVPRGTRFPTQSEFWKRQLVPTCALGEPETLFKLCICEIGDSSGQERSFHWDEKGDLHKLGGKDGSGRVIVPLNESNPTLGYLRPPHPPSDRRPRLDISFEVNAERWLCVSVFDLLSQKQLMKQAPVVRLL